VYFITAGWRCLARARQTQAGVLRKLSGSARELKEHKHALASLRRDPSLRTLLLSRAVTFAGMDAMVSFFRNCAILWPLVLGTGLQSVAVAEEAAGNPDTPFLIRSWQNQQGLPNNTVNAVTQTRDGYLWLGTDEGLARFDGVHCRVFGLADGLRNLQISALLEDSRGGLWIGTAGGGVSRMIHGEITTYSVQDGLAGDSISSFVEATNGEVWIGTHTGLSRWHDGVFTPVAKELGPMLVFDLAKDRQGAIWAATLHNGLLHFADGKFSNAEWKAATSNENPRCVFVDSKNRVWAGLREKAILCLADGTWTRYGTNEGFPEVVTYRLAETADGTIWAGSWNEGLYYLQNGRFNALQKKDGLSNNAILTLFAGREQFLWVGTQSGGLDRIGPKKLSVYHVVEGASECQLRSLAQTTNGEMWLGTYGQGVFQWEPAQFTPLQETRLRAHLLVEAMLGARDGSVWWGAGPSLYQRKDGKLISYYGDTPWLTGDRVWSLCEDREGGMWVGTYNGKLGLLKNGKFTPVNGLSGKPVTALAQETNGTLWIASLGGGLARLQNGALNTFTTKDGLNSDLIRTLLLDADGALWIGTDGGGLNRWANGRMTGFTTRQGLLDDIILQILEDDDGCLWLGCNRGICRVSKRVLNDVAAGKSASAHVYNLGIPEGMASEECVGNFGAALKTQSGQLCFATAKGIVVVDPRRQSPIAALPEALMEGVLVDRVRIEDGKWRMANSQSNPSSILQPPSSLQLPAGQHSYEFHYTGIGFDAPEKIQFRCRLDGLDADWNEVGKTREVTYSYLPPGTYRFRVQAGNLNGEWNEPGAAMAFVVPAYFWQKTWFAVLSAFLVVGLLGAGIRRIERRRYRARLKRIEQEQAMEKERVRIARDLHDELGSSLTYISMSITDLGQSRESSAAQLKARADKISSFAVRTARALDEIVWAVNPRNDSLRSLVEYLTQLARELFENTDVHCRFQIAENLPDVPLPPEMRHHLFLVVKEALNNALKYSRATEIVLSARTDGPRIEIGLQDNGTGFDLAAVQARAERNGLENMRQRMESLGGRFAIETQPDNGTIIKLTVNFPHAHARVDKARG
jgi:signal transduction histidine kinase/streptogramin lyase